jgi:hypothetical protein
VLALCGYMGSPSFFGGVCGAHLFCFLWCGCCFVCLRPVSYVPNVLKFSGLSIIDCPSHHCTRTNINNVIKT